MKLTKRLLSVLILGVALLVGTMGCATWGTLQKARELNQEATRLYQQGHYTEAIVYVEKVLVIREKSLGSEHPSTVTTMNNLALLYKEMGAYDKAESLYKRALTISEKVMGPEHPSTATYLNNLATLYDTMGAYNKAEPLCKRSLAIREKVLGPEHPDTSTSLNNLATLYDTMGAYDKAELLYKRSLAISEKVLGPEHPETAISLNNLALLYDNMGAYDKAEPLYKRALAISETVLGSEHPSTATYLNNLASLYNATGAYDKAEPLYKRSLTIKEKVLESEHTGTALSLNNLAELYKTTGAYDKAEPLYKRSLAIYEKVLGHEHPKTAMTMNNLAELYRTMGDYGKAEPLAKGALAIKEKFLGQEHPDTATSLNNLALIYTAMGAYEAAEPLYKRTLAIYEKTLGTAHPFTASALNNLAVLYGTMGAYDRAEPLLKRTLTIYEKALGPEHPQIAQTLISLAVLYIHKGRNNEALALVEQAQGIDKKQIEQILGFASEAQQTQFLSTREGNLLIYFSLIQQRFPDNPKAVRNALDAWLARKGIILETQKRIQDVLAGEDNTKAREIFADLTDVRQKLARLILGGPGKAGPEAYQKRITDLTNRKEILEGQLSRLSQTFAQQRKTRIATTSAVAAALPNGAVLVEMARIKDYDSKTNKWGAYRYLAFVLSAGKGSGVSLVDLGVADNIDQKVAAFKKSLGKSKTPPDLLAKQSNDFFKTIFVPLTSALGKSRQIFISPDGSLNLIPFEVLQDDQGRYLIETHTFRYVSAGRDIAGYGMIKEKGQKAILMGDPDFNLAAGGMTEEKERPQTRSRNMQGIIE